MQWHWRDEQLLLLVGQMAQHLLRNHPGQADFTAIF
jgi:hypothetical protein